MTIGFNERLERAWALNDSLVCVGLDPDHTKIPDHLKRERYPLFEFNRAVIDATRNMVCAFKPRSLITPPSALSAIWS